MPTWNATLPYPWMPTTTGSRLGCLVGVVGSKWFVRLVCFSGLGLYDFLLFGIGFMPGKIKSIRYFPSLSRNRKQNKLRRHAHNHTEKPPTRSIVCCSRLRSQIERENVDRRCRPPQNDTHSLPVSSQAPLGCDGSRNKQHLFHPAGRTDSHKTHRHSHNKDRHAPKPCKYCRRCVRKTDKLHPAFKFTTTTGGHCSQ